MNSSNAAGVLDQVKGKFEQAVGETFHDEKLANEGVADQVKGHAKEAWGNVKDTAADLTRNDAAEAHAEAHADGNQARSGIAAAAEHAKDSLNRGLDHLKGH